MCLPLHYSFNLPIQDTAIVKWHFANRFRAVFTELPILILYFVGTIPIDPNLSLLCEKGRTFDAESSSPTSKAVQNILNELLKEVEVT